MLNIFYLVFNAAVFAIWAQMPTGKRWRTFWMVWCGSLVVFYTSRLAVSL
jgi:hypothetical protein